MGGFFQDWVGVYGHWVGDVPAVIYILYPLALVGSLLLSRAKPNFAQPADSHRWIVPGGCTGYGVTLFRCELHPWGRGHLGRQGRYFHSSGPAVIHWSCRSGLWRDRAARGFALVELSGFWLRCWQFMALGCMQPITPTVARWFILGRPAFNRCIKISIEIPRRRSSLLAIHRWRRHLPRFVVRLHRWMFWSDPFQKSNGREVSASPC